MNGLTPQQIDDLTQFAWVWATARLGSLSQAQFDQAAVPEALQEWITSYEPFRTQALADVKLWLGIPVLTGIGLDVGVVEPYAVEADIHWPVMIANLTIDVSWSLDMTGRQREGFQFELKRVGLENHRWRVIEFWDEPERAEYLRQMMLLEAFVRRGER